MSRAGAGSQLLQHLANGWEGLPQHRVSDVGPALFVFELFGQQDWAGAGREP